MRTNRRTFLIRGSGAVSASVLWPGILAAAPGAVASRVYRAGIIGRTGAGDYGHGYDQVFNGLEDVKVVALADRDSAGRAKAAARSGAQRTYGDERAMLEQEKPDLVCIAPRHPAGHKELCLAAMQVCRGIFIEKPFTETVGEADDILAEAERRRVKILVAHNRRYTAEFAQVRALLAQGLIGQVRQVEVHGKQDSRAGGEDLIVLGTHDFDLLRWYFGDPLWCQASVTQDGRDITRNDVHPGKEPIRVAGDNLHALFLLPNQVMVHWSSLTRSDQWNTNFSPREKWAFEILGTKGVLGYQSGFGFAWLDSPFFAHREDGPKWQTLPSPRNWEWPEHARHPIRSLIHAIETDSQPVCSGYDGRWAIEMVAAVYESQRLQARVALPLQERGNPLLRF